MTRMHRALVPGALAAMAVVLLLQPGAGTDATWTERSTVTLADPRSDTLSMAAQDATSTVDHSQGSLDLANEPAIRLTNTSAAQQSWIDVVSARITVPAGTTASTLLQRVDVDYDVAPGTDCTTGLGAPYWTVGGGVGSVAAGTTYTRPSSPVAGDTIPPGGTRTLCPWVRPAYGTDTVAGRRDFLLAHAGRQLDLTTTVRQRSHAPATWTSETRSVTTRYQVKAPPPTAPADAGLPVCARADWGLVTDPKPLGLFGRLYWGWPTAAEHRGTGLGAGEYATPAVAGWAVLRSTDGVSWLPLRESNDQQSGPVVGAAGGSADSRVSDDINSDWINNNDGGPLGTNVGQWVWFAVRGYLHTEGGAEYVDSDWMVQLRENGDHVECGAVQPNPHAGPHGL